MRVVSSVCGYCGTGYGVLVEIDAGNIARARGERPHRPCRMPVPRHSRFLATLRRVLAMLAAGGRGAA